MSFQEEDMKIKAEGGRVVSMSTEIELLSWSWALGIKYNEINCSNFYFMGK